MSLFEPLINAYFQGVNIVNVSINRILSVNEKKSGHVSIVNRLFIDLIGNSQSLKIFLTKSYGLELLFTLDELASK